MPIWKDRKGAWRYQFQFKGKRYSKTGFRSREEATQAMGIHRSFLGVLVRREYLRALINWLDELVADKKLKLPLTYFRLKADLER